MTQLLVTSLLLLVFRCAAQESFEIEELTITQLQDGMNSGRWTSRHLVELYSARIEKIDRNGPRLRSVIEMNPDALAIADRLDAERKAGRVRGPLHGIPILLKDNIDTGDRMMTTAGSLALEGFTAPRDAFLVERLRQAGVVILGKTNLSEWANFRSAGSTSGWSARGGQVRNPYMLDRNPCGSSSGSGVAVSANLAAAAVGTETNGSIVCPSAVNGIVGIKPTVGLVSRSGIIPISRTQDTAGPMARTVADAAALLNAMAGVDAGDASMKQTPANAPDYTKALDRGALKGARIGVPRKQFFGYNPKTDELIEAALTVLRAEGAVIVDPVDVPTFAKLNDCGSEILLYEFKAGLNAYLAARGASTKVKSLRELIAFNEKERDREMPYFGQDIFEAAEKKGTLTAAAYRKALATCRSNARALGMDAVMTRHKLDALVAPTLNPAWPTDLVNGDHFVGGSSSAAAVAGYPSVTVPAGQVQGLPVGLSFMGAAWSEAKLISYAYAYEQATKHRKRPTFAETLLVDPAGGISSSGSDERGASDRAR